MATNRRKNFTLSIKAEAYVLDRALCSFTAKSLWLLDWGADPECAVDWIDHVVPCALGGDGSVQNAAAAEWWENKKRGASRAPPAYVFRRGEPTKLFFEQGRTIDGGLREHLRRMQALHVSDWFLNRAVYGVLVGAFRMIDEESERALSRKVSYWAQAAFRMVVRWRRLASAASIGSIEQRRLCPSRELLCADQRALLRVREAETVDDVRSIMGELAPIVSESMRVFDAEAEAREKDELAAFLLALAADRNVSPLYKRRLLTTHGVVPSAISDEASRTKGR